MGEPDEPAERLDEPVHLSDWNPAWPVRAHALAEELTNLLDGNEPVEHIGSTAVEGLRAKPVLDLMVGARDEMAQARLARRLAEQGWSDMGEAGVPGRRHLRRRSNEAVNIHIVLFGASHWTNNLAIRDYLRGHSDERALYAAQKAAIVAGGADRLQAYSEAKAGFMTALLQRATAWRQTQDG